MIKYKNKEKFEEYKIKLCKFIDKNGDLYKDFMSETDNPFNYFEFFETIEFPLSSLGQTTYYGEINIDEIISANSHAITDDNFQRVINAIPYILEDKCEPIRLMRRSAGYHILDGKHRYFAHVLLGKEKVPAFIQDGNGTGSYDNIMVSDLQPLEKEMNIPEYALKIYHENRLIIEDKEIIHNMNFDCSNDMHTVNDIVIPNFNTRKDYMIKERENDTTIVLKILGKQYDRNTVDLLPGDSSILKIGNKVYYLSVLIGNPSKNTEDTIYIIEGNENFEISDLRFVAAFPKKSKEYKILITFNGNNYI
ncbi:hypothetical protein ACOAOT_07555 [Lacrimispora sp. AGF001]